LTSGPNPSNPIDLTVNQVAEGILFGFMEEQPALGLAKELIEVTNLTPQGLDVFFNLTLENVGNVDLTAVQIEDDLAAAFPSPLVVTVLSVSSGTLAVNPSYNGLSNQQLLLGTDILAPGESGVISLDLHLETQGVSGAYYNAARATALSPFSTVTEDWSDEGSETDPNGNGNGNEPGENDPTTIFLPALVPTLSVLAQWLLAAILVLLGLAWIKKH
jgi:hypothetical protein